MSCLSETKELDKWFFEECMKNPYNTKKLIAIVKAVQNMLIKRIHHNRVKP